MGLFSNNKKLCPICGSATPRLLPRKFDDQPICKECEKKLDVPNEILNSMTLNDFRQYLVEYEANAPLRAEFKSTYNYGGGFFGGDTLGVDEEHGLFRLNSAQSSWVFEKERLKSFRILEDDRVLYESGQGTLNYYPSDIPARVEALIPTINAFNMEMRTFERGERLDRLRNSGESDEERWKRESVNNNYRPRFADPRLFREFKIEVTLDHLYWSSYKDTISAPTFDDSYPSVDSYLKRYRENVDVLHTLAQKLMNMITPGAGETQIGSAPLPVMQTMQSFSAAAAPTDAVEEIKKYKELMEQGIITEEEFTDKKKQLLGI